MEKTIFTEDEISPEIISWFEDSRKDNYYKKTTQGSILEGINLYSECDCEYISNDVYYYIENKAKETRDNVEILANLEGIIYIIAFKTIHDEEIDVVDFYIDTISKYNNIDDVIVLQK